MTISANRIAQKEYRRRLRAAGRREVLIDFPVDLLNEIDQIGSDRRRALVVEDLVRQALRAGKSETA